MSDQDHDNTRKARADYAAQMARAEFGRHYVDTERVEQVLDNGEIVLRHKRPVSRDRLR